MEIIEWSKDYIVNRKKNQNQSIQIFKRDQDSQSSISNISSLTKFNVKMCRVIKEESAGLFIGET